MQLRIDELARRAGTTSRNVRAYQARGLLPPPTLSGRTGYYGEEHLRRLELIADLQDRGFSLEAIRHTLDVWSSGGDLGHLVGFRNILTAPLTEEQPQTFSRAEMEERFPEAATRPELFVRAVDLGLLEVDTDDPATAERFVAPSPVLIAAGVELARAGVPLEAVFALVEAIRPDIAHMADIFVGLVSEHLTSRVMEGQASPEDVDAVIQSVHRLRPIAAEVVRPFLARELLRAAQEALEAATEHLSPAEGHAS